MCASAGLVAACSTSPETSSVGTYKVGQPYQEAGVWYYPQEQPDYDATGVASWYGSDFHGKLTANGEVFDARGLTAAHPTLPMPVNVRVTNLENGRSLILRVNDRGPFARGRIIDVSARAAQLLGFYEKGTARVRVTYLARADLPAGRAESTTAIAAITVPTKAVQVASLDPVSVAPQGAAPRASGADVTSAATTTADLAPVMRPSEAPDSSVGHDRDATHYYVQAGAFSQRENAERLKDRLSDAGDLTISSIDRNGALLYRVRIGPFDSVDAADAALARLSGVGGRDAKIVVDQ
ncbi:MAG TPA: septal ring lytic transglycosylase RlpA family protein [Rhizomicrobium sp.]|nr:septal ring lytic transglycosylase RlpA family protein [Rhizomicrobium sp.]